MTKKQTAQNGKGSKPRAIDKETFDKTYDDIFKKKEVSDDSNDNSRSSPSKVE